ncbi:MAG: RpiB/LacA/LacB family sugar-phosphate isomerase [Parcubacteria group bacterium]|nr:RpiB/LacA/LacB family sugar-phosphate isomerase [Parcubacteria group bacterium]
MTKIFIGGDHASFELKKALIPYLRELGHAVEGKGAFDFDKDDDYPDFVSAVALEIFKDPENIRGIVLGGSGQGEAIVANRLPTIRAVVYYGGMNMDIISLSRKHNNSNVLSLGARFISVEEAKQAVKLWLETEFSGEERHVRRNNRIDEVYES